MTSLETSVALQLEEPVKILITGLTFESVPLKSRGIKGASRALPREARSESPRAVACGSPHAS
jgi:hypothetical protein